MEKVQLVPQLLEKSAERWLGLWELKRGAWMCLFSQVVSVMDVTAASLKAANLNKILNIFR
ncbi:hypothetical protein [Collimonas pratensis]|nr:hypothetical protein [Collimonas pratensis]